MRQTVLLITLAALAALLVPGPMGAAYAHGNKHESGGDGSARYLDSVFAVFKDRCAGCHGEKSPEHMVFMSDRNKYVSASTGPRMDNYALLTSFVVWPDTGSLMRSLDDGKSAPDGKPGSMYGFLGSTEAERQKNLGVFKSWVGLWTMKDWDAISKDELDKIQVMY